MLQKISLTKLFQALLSPTNQREYVSLPHEDVVATTVRLEPDIRRYYEDVANELGISLQSIIKIALTGLMRVSQSENKSEITLLLDRFFELFSAYEIAIADIPLFLEPFKIPLSALANNDRLLDLLTGDVLDHISTLFNINVEWLKGCNKSVINSTYRWYKSTNSFCNYLNQLADQKIAPEVIFISNTSRKDMELDKKCGHDSDQSRNTDVGIMLRIPCTTESGIPYHKFEVFESGPWGYEKTRIDLKLIMMFCVRNRFNKKGIFVSKSDFDRLFQGYCLPIVVYEKNNQVWDPTDYVSTGFNGDTDSDELLNVVHHYCNYFRIHQECDRVSKSGYNSPGRFSLNFDKYSNEIKSLEELTTA